MATPVSEAWSRAKRILCVRLDALGDVLMTAPALRAVHERAEVTLLTSRSGAAAAALLPEVSSTLVYNAPWMKHDQARSGTDDHAMIGILRACAFDAAIIFTVYSQSPLPAALLCHLAGIPLRVAHCRENPYGLLTTWLPETEPESRIRHEVTRQIDLAAAVGFPCQDPRMRVVIPEAAIAWAGQVLAQGRRGPMVIVHPGATAASRRYPEEQFAAAARMIIDHDSCHVVFTGSATEAALIARIQEQVGRPTRAVIPEDLAGFAALIAAADLLISNNTAPVHIASAVGTPVVDLYALTNPQHTPWQVPNRVLSKDVPCKYCYRSICPEGHHLCLSGIDPGTVAVAARALLQESGAEAPA